jgi:hypothetical protein
MRKAIAALFTLAVLGLAQPALARGGGGGGHGGGGGGHGFGGGGGHFGGGGFHGFGGGGFHGFAGGGFHGGGFHGGGFHGRFAGRHRFIGFGFGPYAYYDGYYPYDYNDYYEDGSCRIIRRRVMTHYGWRVRHVEVCG